ncbi:MAG: VCBS repeat-containing protein [bacterium]|nr:MAG: VCBS repeat-containing protein [bacterium]
MKYISTILVSSALLFVLPAFSNFATPIEPTPVQKGHTAKSKEVLSYAPDHILVQFTKSAYNNSSLKICLQRGASVTDGITGIASVDAISKDVGAVKISRAFIQPKNKIEAERLGVERWFIIDLPEGADIEKVVQKYADDPNVEYANPDYRAFPAVEPTDPLYSKHWGHKNTGQQLQSCDDCYKRTHEGDFVGSPGFDATAEAAWDGSQGYGSSDVIIAILDTGVELDHPDLVSNLVAGYDWGDGDTNPDDDSAEPGHGTCCAGVAAAIADNGEGACGIAPGCKVMPVKVFNSNGRLFLSVVVDAIYWAVDNDADIDIISMSFGEYISSYPAMDAAISYAYGEGVTLLAATHNDNYGYICYPACNQYVIAVGAAAPCGDRKRSSSDPMWSNQADPYGVTCDGECWWGSNYGTNRADAAGAVDVLAPTLLPTPDIQGSGGYVDGDYYLFFGGTSCATPYAAGVCALIKSANPTWTPLQIRNQLIGTAIDITSGGSVPGWDRYSGYGMVDAAAAVGGGTGAAPVAAFSGTPTSGDYPLEVCFTDESLNDPASWSWTFGDGGTSTSQNPSHVYTYTGTYTVSLTVTNEYGSDTMTKPYYIVVIDESLFEPAVNYPAGDSPHSVISSDFDGDGDIDLAVANFDSDNVSVLLGNGDGTFATGEDCGAGDGPHSVISNDFNGDGYVDLAVANFDSDNVSILLGNGNGTFASAVNCGTGESPRSVTSNDFNGDGKVDLAVAHHCIATDVMISIHFGYGDGTFASGENAGAGNGPQSVTSDDFDGDGDSDLAVANYYSENASVLLGDGEGNFAFPINYNTCEVSLYVTSSDFDGNGYGDLAVANYLSDNVSILLGDVYGIFYLTGAYNYSAGTHPSSVTSSDFDDDGDVDLAVANSGSDNVSILLGNGDGTFISVGSYNAGDGSYSVTSGDFDGDGDSDLAVANSGSDNVSILINIGAVPVLDYVSLADDYLVMCPAGDADYLQVHVDFVDNTMTNTIAPSEIWIQVPDDDNLSFFTDEDKIYADSAATEENGWHTTITWIYGGGYYQGTLSVGLMDEIIAETDPVTIKSPDHNVDGKVSISDWIYLDETYNKCEGDSLYNKWMDFIISSSPSCVNISDFVVFGDHYSHSYPCGGDAMLASGKTTEAELEVIETPGDDGTLKIGFNLISPESYRALAILLQTGDYQFVNWDSEGSTAIQVERDGRKCMFIFSFESGEISGSNPILGTLTMKEAEREPVDSESQSQDESNDDIILLGGELMRIDGKILRIAGEEVKTEEEVAKYPDRLWRNYPNPFNPVTTIRYSVSKDCRVSLKIFNVRGQLIKTLVDDFRKKGEYTMKWSGTNNRGNNIASGVYFYRLEAGHYTDTKKMVLLR